MSGKEHDLSGLGIPLETPKTIRIEVVEKQLTVFAEDKKLFSKTYTESIGDLTGIRYRFLGAGEINSIKLTDLKEEVILMDEDFQTLNIK